MAKIVQSRSFLSNPYCLVSNNRLIHVRPGPESEDCVDLGPGLTIDLQLDRNSVGRLDK